MTAVVLGNASCVRDTDCGICDPDNLILESISGLNYASKKIHFLNPTCEGDDCPKAIKKGSYFVEEVLPCEKDEDTLDFIQKLADAGVIDDPEDADEIEPYVDEFCKISPLVVAFGIEFVFNNLLDPTTVELVRKRPDQPKLFEVYEWKTKILDIIGPTSRYNGDFTKGAAEVPDVITRLVSLSCIDNLRDQGQDYSNEDYEDPATNPCNTVFDHDDDNDTPPVPLKMRIGTDDSKLQSYRGITTAGSNSCDTPQEGADTCCTECDFLLGTKVAKYGVDESGNRLSPGNGAIECNAVDGDPVQDCAGFRPSVERGDNRENSYNYYWDAPADQGGEQLENQSVPQYDRLRETHYDARPAWLDKTIAPCASTTACNEVHGLPAGVPTAYVCVGETPEGQACLPDLDMTGTCTDAFCRPQWFVTCAANPDTTGGDTGYCVDRRFSNAGAAACYRAGDDFDGQCNEEGQSCRPFNSGQRLANCNGETPVDSNFTAAECCQSSLGAEDLSADDDGIQCDPFFQSDISPVARYDRNENLPDQTRACVCRKLSDMDDDELELCGRTVEQVCYGPDGDFLDFREGEYAVKFIDRRGGVVYDPAIKGVEWRPADLGGIPRAEIETCAEAAGLIGARGRHDGWRANDAFLAESFEDYDRAMCSGQEYTVRFGVPGESEFIADKVGNTMEGHAEYTFTTTQFHVVPGSGFPTDNLRIGACDQFSLRFSNKYDMSPENQRKLEIYRLDDQGTADEDDDEITTPNDDCGEIVPVAGGINCVDSADGLRNADGTTDFCASPCLTVDIADQGTGEVRVEIDPTEFGSVLKVNSRYRMRVAGLGDLGEIEDDDQYRAAFWDACGMPLVAENAEPYEYDFTIDTPKCKEDSDNDQIQLSCDNAKDNFNPFQEDLDRDGIGDVIDLCPTVAAEGGNSADSDKDGVGNDCDTCRQTLQQYNDVDSSIAVPDYMFVRNIPLQGDFDQDGIGDVCDNCVVTPNCEDYGTDNPYRVGDPIDVTDPTRCQRDDDADLIGDDCIGADPLPTAAGDVGIAPMDDFDQDGITNVADACPRQPVPAPMAVCESAADCSDIQACDDGVCNHIDSDSDGVGDICDSCPFTPNPMQTMDGAAQEEDADGDFVADVCETNSSCSNISDARPFAFYDVSANGQCCTVQLVEDPMGNLVNAITTLPLKDPDGWPVSLTCVEPEEEEDRVCRRLPSKVENAPGIISPPPGCEQALADVGITAAENQRIGLEDVDSVDDLWNQLCFLPQTDQDYDGLGDPCDYCDFAYDPDNQSYVDANGRAWPNYGKYCYGDYDPEVNCGMGTDDDTGSGSESGTDSSGGGMSSEGSGGMGESTGPG